jgi:hypothetical protein
MLNQVDSFKTGDLNVMALHLSGLDLSCAEVDHSLMDAIIGSSQLHPL